MTLEKITDYYGREHVLPGPWRTVGQVKLANAQSGHHFFSREAMRSFGSRVAPGVTAGRFIITSEQDRTPYRAEDERAWGGERRYTIRLISDEGTVEPIRVEGYDDDFMVFGTLREARSVLARLVGGAVASVQAEWLK